MATSKQVQKILQRFTNQLDRANSEVAETIKLITELEKALEQYNADEDLEITRGIKSEIKRGRKQVDELRGSIKKLDQELSDTNRKYHYLAT